MSSVARWRASDGVLITKRGRPVAKLMPVISSCVTSIGSVKGIVVDPDDDLFSTGTSGMLNLDTHILLKSMEGSLTLPKQTILTGDPEWGISAIVLWEITKLHQLVRIRYSLDHPLVAAVFDKLWIWPISREVCLNLRVLDFQSDPADEIIAATNLAHNIPLLTRDARIKTSRVVRCL